MGQRRHSHPGIGQPVGDIVAGRLPLHRCVGRQDDLADCRIGSAADQRRDAQLVRADAVERREGAAKNVIAAPEGAGALHRPQITDLFDDAQERRVAARVGADAAGVGGIDIAAGAAGNDLGDRFGHRAGQRRHRPVLVLDHIEGGPAGAARAEARQFRQQLDQAFDLRAGHERSVRTAV